MSGPSTLKRGNEECRPNGTKTKEISEQQYKTITPKIPKGQKGVTLAGRAANYANWRVIDIQRMETRTATSPLLQHHYCSDGLPFETSTGKQLNTAGRLQQSPTQQELLSIVVVDSIH